ncbi:MAG: hypothetical protein ACP5Q5_07530 [Brevinematia bacterium]
MALEAELLANNYQIPQDFAQKLLNFTKNNIDAAIKILESSEKSIAIIKGKFITNKKVFNGAFILAYNFELRDVIYIFFVVSNDASISRLSVEISWKDFYSELQNYANANSANMEISHEIERILTTPENKKYIHNFFIDYNNIDEVNMKRFITSELSKLLMDTGVAVKTHIELIDTFRFEKFLSLNPLGQKPAKKASKDIFIILNLKVEPVLAPIGGLEIGSLEFGDELLLRIKDDREIVQFIFSFIDPASFQSGAVYATIVSKEMDETTGNFAVRVEFGPGIFGSFVLGNKVRVQAKKKAISPPPKPEKQPQKETKKNTKKYEEIDYSKYYPINDYDKDEFFEKGPFQTFVAVTFVLLILLIIVLLFI